MRYQVIPLIFATSLVTASARAGDTRIVEPTTRTVRYVIEGNKVIPTDAYGRKQHNKPYYTIEGDKIVLTDPYGHKLYGRDTLEVKRGE